MNERIEKLLKEVFKDMPKINERIKELAEQACIKIDGFGYGEGNIEKFAELIVKECVDVLGDYGVDYVEQTLNEHFGIE